MALPLDVDEPEEEKITIARSGRETLNGVGESGEAVRVVGLHAASLLRRQTDEGREEVVGRTAEVAAGTAEVREKPEQERQVVVPKEAKEKRTGHTEEDDEALIPRRGSIVVQKTDDGGGREGGRAARRREMMEELEELPFSGIVSKGSSCPSNWRLSEPSSILPSEMPSRSISQLSMSDGQPCDDDEAPPHHHRGLPAGAGSQGRRAHLPIPGDVSSALQVTAHRPGEKRRSTLLNVGFGGAELLHPPSPNVGASRNSLSISAPSGIGGMGPAALRGRVGTTSGQQVSFFSSGRGGSSSEQLLAAAEAEQQNAAATSRAGGGGGVWRALPIPELCLLQRETRYPNTPLSLAWHDVDSTPADMVMMSGGDVEKARGAPCLFVGLMMFPTLLRIALPKHPPPEPGQGRFNVLPISVGRFLVADASSHCVWMLTLPGPDSSSASAQEVRTQLVAGSGKRGFQDGHLDVCRMDGPCSLTLDPHTHDVYVADRGNHAVRRIDLSSGLPGIDGSLSDGTSTCLYLSVHEPLAPSVYPNGALWLMAPVR